jgi:hypothetical protein
MRRSPLISQLPVFKYLVAAVLAPHCWEPGGWLLRSLRLCWQFIGGGVGGIVLEDEGGIGGGSRDVVFIGLDTHIVECESLPLAVAHLVGLAVLHSGIFLLLSRGSLK